MAHPNKTEVQLSQLEYKDFGFDQATKAEWREYLVLPDGTEIMIDLMSENSKTSKRPPLMPKKPVPYEPGKQIVPAAGDGFFVLKICA